MDEKWKESEIPLEIIGDFVFEARRRINLPLNEFFLEPIAGNFTQNLKEGSEIKNESKKEIDENGKIGMELRKLGLTLREAAEELVMIIARKEIDDLRERGGNE